MRYNDVDPGADPGFGADEDRPRSRRPSFGEAVGPGFVPDLTDDDEGGDRRRGRRGRRPRVHTHHRGGFGPAFGPPPPIPGPPGLGPGFGFGPGGPRGRRGRGRGRPRGDVRAAILLLLEEGPRHGYQLTQDITERSGGTWSPSAGSIYPTLQVLEDEGLVTIEPVDGRKTASLTEAGGTYVAENRERLGTPWQQADGEDDTGIALRDAMLGLGEAAKQVFRVGTDDQQRRAVQVVTEARTSLYRILAEDPGGDEG